MPWLLTAFAKQPANPPSVTTDPPYWPLSTPSAAVNSPRGNEQKGGIGSTNDRYSLILTPYEDNPEYGEVQTRHIAPTFPGEDGYSMVSTVHPYDKVVAVFTQPAQRMVSAWQNPVYGPDHRPLLTPPAVGSSMVPPKPDPTRPAVFQTDYTVNTLTSDAAMVYGPQDNGWSGVDWNAYSG